MFIHSENELKQIKENTVIVRRNIWFDCINSVVYIPIYNTHFIFQVENFQEILNIRFRVFLRTLSMWLLKMCLKIDISKLNHGWTSQKYTSASNFFCGFTCNCNIPKITFKFLIKIHWLFLLNLLLISICVRFYSIWWLYGREEKNNSIYIDC